MEREPEPREADAEERDVTTDPGEAVREARQAQSESGAEQESTTQTDQVRESGFGA